MADCGCTVSEVARASAHVGVTSSSVEIVFCPMHQAAEQMKELKFAYDTLVLRVQEYLIFAPGSKPWRESRASIERLINPVWTYSSDDVAKGE